MTSRAILIAVAIASLSMHWPAFAGSNTLADTMFKAADSADINEDYQDASAKYLDLISKIRQSDPGNLKILRAKARLARIYIVGQCGS